MQVKMKILLGAWILFVLQINLNSGHYIRSTGDEDSAVYEVRDDSGVTFVNPKAKQPTLREILYYHIIERPYEKENPSHPETERSFTNSHGDESSLDESIELLNGLTKTIEENDDDNHEDYRSDVDDEKETDLGLHQEEEAPEIMTEPNPLSDEEVKRAYRARSYIFDQARQRFLPKRMVPVGGIVRRKRQAEFEAVPEAPQLPGDAKKDTYIQPNTYGMNLNPEGGYVWNNLNKPATYSEVGQSPFGDQSEGQNEQSQETTQPPTEIYYPSPPAPENSNSDNLEDININTDRLPLALSSYDEPLNEKSAEAKYPTDTIVNENAPEEPTSVAENAEEVEPAENPGSNENPDGEQGPQHEQPASEVENAYGDKIRKMPEAPTLAPLNYDNLPDYIRDAILPTEKTASYEQTDNPHVIPQLNPEDKKEIEDIFGTVQPVEDIPKTYGMNLTSGSGHVWNDLVNPPVSYDVGSTISNQKEEETQVPTISEQPEISNPSEEPSSPEENKDSQGVIAVVEEPENTEPSQEEVIPNDNNEQPQIEQPAEPIKPNEPSVPIEPIGPEQPAEPQEPENETELPAEPEIEPTKPHEDENEPISPIKPEIPFEPTEPHEDENEPISPIKPEIPFEPTEPHEDENEPISPIKPEIPFEPAEPHKNENEPISPIESQTPFEPTEPHEDENEHKRPVEPVKPEKNPINPEVTVPQPESDESEDIPKLNESEPNKKSDLPKEEEHDFAEPTPEDDANKPDIMSKLLQSEEFWKWLGKWTATYTELLEKHIRKIAIQEICNREKHGSQMCLLDDKSGDFGPIIEDGKFLLDGREISLNHSDNLASSLLRGHKGDKGHRIDATTIYGNSVGNERVTNVFIFNPDNAKGILEELKPENDSNVDFIIDERIKEEIKKPVKKETEAEKDKDEEKETKGDEIEPAKESGDEKKDVAEDVKEINEPNKPVPSELNKVNNAENQAKDV